MTGARAVARGLPRRSLARAGSARGPLAPAVSETVTAVSYDVVRNAAGFHNYSLYGALEPAIGPLVELLRDEEARPWGAVGGGEKSCERQEEPRAVDVTGRGRGFASRHAFAGAGCLGGGTVGAWGLRDAVVLGLCLGLD